MQQQQQQVQDYIGIRFKPEATDVSHMKMQEHRQGQAAQLVNEKRELLNKEIPQGKVLIRVLYAAVEQVDRAILALKSYECQEECALGAEGCGIIEKVGAGVDQSMVGKKCAFAYGSWQNYLTRDFDKLIVFNNHHVSEKAISRAFVNPMTALCLRDRVKSIISKEMKHTHHRKVPVFFLGAETSLGRIFNRLCMQMNSDIFEFVPILRNKEDLSSLNLEEGKQSYFLAGEKGSLLPEKDILSFLSHEHRIEMPAIVIDAWADRTSSQLIKLVPKDSRVILLGNMSENEKLEIDTTDFFLRNKRIEGFNLLKYLQEGLSKERRLVFYDFIRDDFDTHPQEDGLIFSLKRKQGEKFEEKVFRLEEYEKALKALEQNDKACILLDCSVAK